MRHMPDGKPDTQFGSNGIATTTAGTGYTSPDAFSLAVQADDKIVAAGETLSLSTAHLKMLIVRFEKNGKIDASFGEGKGMIIQSFGTGTSSVKTVLIQPDNKILTVGYYYDFIAPTVFALARFQSNGILDSSFGENGLVTTDIGEGAVTDCAGGELQLDGKILVAGATYKYNIDNPVFKFALARYNGGDAILPHYLQSV